MSAKFDAICRAGEPMIERTDVLSLALGLQDLP